VENRCRSHPNPFSRPFLARLSDLPAMPSNSNLFFTPGSRPLRPRPGFSSPDERPTLLSRPGPQRPDMPRPGLSDELASGPSPQIAGMASSSNPPSTSGSRPLRPGSDTSLQHEGGWLYSRLRPQNPDIPRSGSSPQLLMGQLPQVSGTSSRQKSF